MKVRPNLSVNGACLRQAHYLKRWAENMKTRHYFSGAALRTSIVLTAIGVFKGAAVLVGLATAIKLIASIVSGKKIDG